MNEIITRDYENEAPEYDSNISKLNRFSKDNKKKLDEYLKENPFQNELANNPNFGYDVSCAETFPRNSEDFVKRKHEELNNMKTLNMRNQEDFTNFIPHNDPTNFNLMETEKKSNAEFIHNNMVPYFGKKITQDMRGTGVEGDFDLLTKTGVDSETPNKTLVASNTGVDSTYLHKREAGPFFSPAEQQTGWVFSTPLFRPEKDRYTQALSGIRNDLKPVEAIKVGPGIGVDPKIPAQGGFHQYTRILPNNVNDYKANQLPGRVVLGKHMTAGLPTSYPGVGTSQDEYAPGVAKNRPNSYWEQARYPTMSSKVGFTQDFDYNRGDYTIDFKPKSSLRNQTSYGLGNIEYQKTKESFNGTEGETPCVNNKVTVGQGPLGSKIAQTPLRNDTWMSMDNNIRSRVDNGAVPVGNPHRSHNGFGNISTWYVNETDRGAVNPQNIEQLNLTRERNGTTSFYTYVDEPKTRMAETTTYSYAGNASRGKDGSSFYSYKDEPKTKMAETTLYSHVGGAADESKGAKFWTFVDQPHTTMKETTEFFHTGAPAKSGFAETNRSLFTGFDEE